MSKVDTPADADPREKWRGVVALASGHGPSVPTLCAVFLFDGEPCPCVWDDPGRRWLKATGVGDQVLGACLLAVLGRVDRIDALPAPKAEARGQRVGLGPYDLSKAEARALGESLRQVADEIREPGCSDPFAHWEGHCGCGK